MAPPPSPPAAPPVTAAPAPRPSRPDPGRRRRGGHRRVLPHHPHCRAATTSRWWRRCGARSRVQSRSPASVDTVLLDMMLGDGTGLDLYRRIRQIRPDLPDRRLHRLCRQRQPSSRFARTATRCCSSPAPAHEVLTRRRPRPGPAPPRPPAALRRLTTPEPLAERPSERASDPRVPSAPWLRLRLP